MKRVILVLVFVTSSSLLAGENVKQDIIKRCQSQMGQYGASLVKACVDQDINAIVAI